MDKIQRQKAKRSVDNKIDRYKRRKKTIQQQRAEFREKVLKHKESGNYYLVNRLSHIIQQYY